MYVLNNVIFGMNFIYMLIVILLCNMQFIYFSQGID